MGLLRSIFFRGTILFAPKIPAAAFSESAEFDERERQFLIYQLKMKSTNETAEAVAEPEVKVEPKKDETPKKLFDEIVFGGIDEVPFWFYIWALRDA